MKRFLLLLVLVISSCSFFDETIGFAYYSDFSKGLINLIEDKPECLIPVDDPEEIGFLENHSVYYVETGEVFKILGRKASYEGKVYISYFSEENKQYANVVASSLVVKADVMLETSNISFADIYAIVDLKSKFVVDGFFKCTAGDPYSYLNIRLYVANLGGCMFALPQVASQSTDTGTGAETGTDTETPAGENPSI